MIILEQNVLSTTRDTQQQINVVDDTTLQAALSSMSEVEVNAFLEELNKTGKACKMRRKKANLILKMRAMFFA